MSRQQLVVSLVIYLKVKVDINEPDIHNWNYAGVQMGPCPYFPFWAAAAMYKNIEETAKDYTSFENEAKLCTCNSSNRMLEYRRSHSDS